MVEFFCSAPTKLPPRKATSLNLYQGDAVGPSMPGGSWVAGILEPQLPDLRAQLLRHARHAVHDAWLAEDLVQETLIVVMQKNHTRRGESTLLTWSVGILKHKVADWYRSPSCKRMVQLDADDEQLEPAIQALHNCNGAYVDPVRAWQQPENREELRQMMAVLSRCLGCLPKQTGRVFMMREWLGFETSEICQRAAISAENCRTILHRARSDARLHATRLGHRQSQAMNQMDSRSATSTPGGDMSV